MAGLPISRSCSRLSQSVGGAAPALGPAAQDGAIALVRLVSSLAQRRLFRSLLR